MSFVGLWVHIKSNLDSDKAKRKGLDQTSLGKSFT